MKKILLTILIFSIVPSFADGDNDGVYLGIQGGYGLNNNQLTNVNQQNNNLTFNSDAALRATFGIKVDSYFGFEVSYDNGAITQGNNSNIDLMLNYYQEISNKWDLVYQIGPYYNFQVSNVGIAGAFGAHYYITPSTKFTITDIIYVNPSINSNYNSIQPYLLSNQVLAGLQWSF